MNIRDITIAQQPQWNPAINEFMKPNTYFKQYAEFCMSRRSYKRKQGKGLTRSVYGRTLNMASKGGKARWT